MTTHERSALPHPERARTQAAWDALAANFDRHLTPRARPLAEASLRRVDLRPGMRFLDVGAGSGALSLPAARLGARVLATDVAPEMLARLEARARAEGLSDLATRAMDGQALDLDDATFDVAGSQNGVTVFPDLARGLAELARVTKPGGRVLVVALGPPPKAEFLTFFVAALKATVPGFTGLPTNPPPRPFQLADPGKVRDAMTEAGLENVRVDTRSWRMEHPSARHLWDTVTASNPIGALMVADLTPQQREEAQGVLDGMLRERSGGRPAAVLNTEMNIGLGIK